MIVSSPPKTAGSSHHGDTIMLDPLRPEMKYYFDVGTFMVGDTFVLVSVCGHFFIGFTLFPPACVCCLERKEGGQGRVTVYGTKLLCRPYE